MKINFDRTKYPIISISINFRANVVIDNLDYKNERSKPGNKFFMLFQKTKLFFIKKIKMKRLYVIAAHYGPVNVEIGKIPKLIHVKPDPGVGLS